MPDPTPEIWKPIPGYEGFYDVSNLGQVRSVSRVVNSKGSGTAFMRGRVLKPFRNDQIGHLGVKLSRYSERKTFFVHTLVMSAFVGQRPESMSVCHGIGGITDNRLSNLRYDTVAENCRDLVRHGRHW